MALAWRNLFSRPTKAKLTAPTPTQRFSGDFPADLIAAINGGGNLAPRISRAEAMQVTAVLRARNLICASLGALPIRVYATDNSIPANAQYLMPNPDPEIGQSVVIANTIEDLMFEGVAWWRVTAFGWHGYPVAARWIPHESVLVAPTKSVLPSQLRISPDEPFPAPSDGGRVYIDGYPVPDDEVIRFDSPNPPLLRHAARAIRTCLLLDQTTALYADDPQPLNYFKPVDGADPRTDDEIQDLLDDWQSKRKTRATGYLEGVDLISGGYTPEQLQLADARQHAVLEIARATGVDPEDLGVSTTSRTYANQEQREQARINYTLMPYIAAIQDRLSLRDVLPRGYEARFDLSGFLRGDALTRMQAYATGLQVGAYADKDEVRAAEGKPPLTAAQKAAAKPAPPAAPQQQDNTPPALPADAQQNTRERKSAMSGNARQTFSAGDTVRVTFAAADRATFQVDSERRTITGLMLPWGAVADNGAGKWRFTDGSVNLPNDVGRVKLNMNHNSTELIGVATRLQTGRTGLTGTFKLGRGPAADQALADAEDGILDGFSVEVDFSHPDSFATDPTDDSVWLVRQSNLRGAALTGTPAFDDARLTSVKASRNQKGVTVADTTGQPAAGATVDFDAYLTGLADKMSETHKQLTQGLAESLGESFTAGVKAALEGITTPQDGPQPVRASRFMVTREAPVYAFNGEGHSLVRDAWYAGREQDGDAIDRLRKFRMQSEEVTKLAHTALANRAQFTTSTTSNASQIIPPGYRPELFVPMLAQGRPMVSACSQGVISNATPFVVPTFGTFSGATGDNVEGVNPTDGSTTFGSKTVTPGAISGRLVLSREIVDAANPAIDMIALNAMRESYARQTEAKVYTMLNGANGAGGTITAGLVPSGAQAATFASTGGTPYPEVALIKGIRQQLAGYPFARFLSPQVGLMGQNATKVIAGTADSTGRPIFPSINPQNTIGQGVSATQGWQIDTVPFIPAWAMTGVTAGDSQILIMNQIDSWVWESPTLLFRFEEKQGPDLIELALFGYFATQLLRPVGLSGVRIT